MLNRIKKSLKDNQEQIAVAVAGAAAATLALVTYTYVCHWMGYEMVKPSHYDKDFFYVVNINGKLMKCSMIPDEA